MTPCPDSKCRADVPAPSHEGAFACPSCGLRFTLESGAVYVYAATPADAAAMLDPTVSPLFPTDSLFGE